MKLEVTIHKEVDAIESILPKWAKMKEEFHEITVFQDSNWLQSWWAFESKKRELTPYIVEIKKDLKTIGIIPMYCSIKKFANLNFRILKPLGAVLSDYLIPILSKEYSSEKLLRIAF